MIRPLKTQLTSFVFLLTFALQAFAIDLVALRAELDSDPLGRGYAAMTDKQAADDLNLLYRTRPRTTMATAEILEAVDFVEYRALTNAQEAEFWDLMHFSSEVDPFGFAATLFIDIFPGGGATLSLLATLRQQPISRGAELGFGVVSEGHVVEARRL